MKVMFMGTPDIAVPCLEALIEKHQVMCVVTQPDKPKNRGQKMAMSPVKELALTHGIDVLQPTKFKDEAFLPELERYNPDVIVVIAYGRILPKYVLEYPKHGCINVHASLLPKYRGAAPIQWCIVDGEKVTGITTMLMNEGLDTGDMLLKEEIAITDTMTGGELHDKMAQMCPAILLETLDKIEEIVPEKQDDSLSCYASMIDKSMTVIDWTKNAQEIVNLVRGMNPLPSARTTADGKLLKVFVAEIGSAKGGCGKVLDFTGGIVVGCGDGSVILTEVQPEGKRRMSAKDYLQGNKIKVGDLLI